MKKKMDHYFQRVHYDCYADLCGSEFQSSESKHCTKTNRTF